jgi:hypothetical protein
MTKHQNAFMQMLAATDVVCQTYASVWSTNVAFSAAFAAGVQDVRTAVAAALAQQGSGTKGITATKRTARKSLEADLFFIASRLEVYAQVAGDATLATEAHLTANGLSRAKDDTLVGIVTRIAALASAHVAALAPYGLTPATVAALSASGTAYTALIGAPARQRGRAKEGTQSIAALLQTARRQLGIMDGLMVLWRDTQADFCEEYFTVRRLKGPGFRRRALELQVQNAEGAAVAGAVLSLPADKLMRRTSARGVCRISHLPEGLHRAELRAKGYTPQEAQISISAGETTRLTFVLHPA